MNAQELFYITATIALIIVSAFILFFFLVLIRLRKAADAVERSVRELAADWRHATLASAAIKIFKTILRRLYA